MQAPPVVEEQKFENTAFFEPFPASDAYVLTLVAIDYLGVIKFQFRDDEPTMSPGVILHYGTKIDGKPLFL